MTTIAVVQGRLSSSRFPGKVLEDIEGVPVIGWVMRAAAAIPGVDRAVLATSDGADDDRLAQWAAANGYGCHRGPLDDVLARFMVAIRAENADTVLRITADCPFLDPVVAGELLFMTRRAKASYGCNFDPRGWPDGLDVEVFTRDAIEATATEATEPYEREHVTPFLRANEHRFRVARLPSPWMGLGEERWTLDHPEDLDFLKAVARRLPSRDRAPSWLEVMAVLDAEPGLRAINAAAVARPSSGAAWRPPTRDLDVTRSRRMLERSLRTVPVGSQTFSKSSIQYPQRAPMFLDHGDGARVWDIDGNCYVDMVCGLLPVVLGYRDRDVDAAVREQLDRGVSFSLATTLETTLAERLVRLVPCAEMVRYGKNGTDATSAAIRLARAHTGRDRVAVAGYHGWQDWYIGATARNKGVPAAVGALTHMFTFGDAEALDRVLGEYPGEFAAVMLEPVSSALPPEGYLAAVRDVAHRHGALLVFDEIITGFRMHIGGAQTRYGVTPDLACFGKAIANGHPLSAIAGRADVMRQMDQIFFSGTFGGEALSLAAAIATVDKMERLPVIDTLWARGSELATMAEGVVRRHGLGDTVRLLGEAPWKILAFADHAGGGKDAIKTLFVREMLQRGVLINASHNVCFALTDDDVGVVGAAWEGAIGVVAAELARGDLDRRMGNDIVRPIFQVRKAS